MLFQSLPFENPSLEGGVKPTSAHLIMHNRSERIQSERIGQGVGTVTSDMTVEIYLASLVYLVCLVEPD